MTTTTTNKDPNRDELIRLRKELAKAGGMKGWQTPAQFDWEANIDVMVEVLDKDDPFDPRMVLPGMVKRNFDGEGYRLDPFWGSPDELELIRVMPERPSPEALSIQSQIDALKGEKGGE